MTERELGLTLAFESPKGTAAGWAGQVRYDKNGVPILSSRQVEQRAAELLREFDPTSLEDPRPTLLGYIAKKLEEQGRMKLVYDISLGTRDGLRVLGRIELDKRRILISPELIRSDGCGPVFRFTLAHELGHLILHCDAPLRLPEWANGAHSDDRRSVLDRTWRARTPMEWLESQANRFAAALLMPAEPVRYVVVACQALIGITPARMGYIYHDSQPVNDEDMRRIVTAMKKRFEVSYSAAKRRLAELDILHECGGEANRIGRSVSNMTLFREHGGDGRTERSVRTA